LWHVRPCRTVTLPLYVRPCRTVRLPLHVRPCRTVSLPLYRRHWAMSKRDNHVSIRGVTSTIRTIIHNLITLPISHQRSVVEFSPGFLQSLFSTFAFPPCFHHCCGKFKKYGSGKSISVTWRITMGGRGGGELAVAIWNSDISIPHSVTRKFFFSSFSFCQPVIKNCS